MGMTLKNNLLMFLAQEPKELKEIYEEFKDTKKTTIRGRINENVGEVFEKIDKGVYIAKKKNYSLILADPPWSYKKNAGRGKATNHYSCMNLEEIKNLPVSEVCKDNAVLFLWATFPLIQEALDVIKAWGFVYKTIGFNWIKTNKDGSIFKGIGNYTRSNSEACLIGLKGKGIPRINKSISQIIISQRKGHSAKPHKTYKLIEELYGEVKRLEMFSRHKREGWDCWGDETPKETQKVLK